MYFLFQVAYIAVFLSVFLYLQKRSSPWWLAPLFIGIGLIGGAIANAFVHPLNNVALTVSAVVGIAIALLSGSKNDQPSGR